MSSSNANKQRLIGAGVLVAIIAITLPFILNKEKVSAPATVDIPLQPERQALNLPEQPIELADFPQQQADPNEVLPATGEHSEPADEPQDWVEIPQDTVAPVVTPEAAAPQPAPVKPSVAEPKPAPKPAPKPVVKAEPKPEAKPVVKPAPVVKAPAEKAKPAAPGLNKNNLPASWSVQLARVSKREGAEKLRDQFRAKQYNAYVRAEEGFFYVRIGPLVKQADAQAMCRQLKQREQQDCFVVSFKP
ncbi:SPOR domain-containing protein [Thiopseudomonas alkaliphila]|uniref:SPOR domain-containing protein n=1 Tax=Thiopseudomonas alkaliphila TaxID=1697053 RepID=UPI0025767BA0|nr:SPOR domain-containing protein [Thiopseudomonas alkaliphila]MDM1707075.1 SPOR domain-containing protein [Thiopseudomonas alkaliphila]